MNAATGHHPGLYATGRHGCWARCSCGWESQLFTTVTGAHLAFGQHLTGVPATRPVVAGGASGDAS